MTFLELGVSWLNNCRDLESIDLCLKVTFLSEYMIEEKAIIVNVENEFAWVETQRKSTCSACQVNKGCGTSLLSNVLGQKRTRLKLKNPGGFQAGDHVVLGLEEGALVKGSLLLYALPLVFMFAFAMIGYGIFFLYELVYSEGYKILFSLAGLIIGFWFVASRSGKLSTDSRYHASILRKVEETAPITFKRI